MVIKYFKFLKFFKDEFFEPNYGLPEGNETVVIKKYKGELSNILFKNDTSLIFTCEKPGPDLICKSPRIFEMLSSYQAHVVIFNSTKLPLGIEFILYENRTINSLFPSVMPSGTSPFDLIIQLNKEFTMLQGSVIINVGIGDKQLSLYDIKPYEKQSNVTTKISPLTTGNYEIALFYKHPSALVVRNQFQFTQSLSIGFIDDSGIISFFNSSNIQYINQEINVTITHSKPVDQIYSKYIICKLGNETVATTNISNGYQCSFIGKKPGKQNITLWYKNGDTKNGEFLLSTNQLPVVFVEKVNISEIDPFASGIADDFSAFKVKANLKTNQLIDYYSEETTYQCQNENILVSAIYQNGIYSCDLSTTNQTSREVFISLFIVSKATGYSLELSNTGIKFLFYGNSNNSTKNSISS